MLLDHHVELRCVNDTDTYIVLITVCYTL